MLMPYRIGIVQSCLLLFCFVCLSSCEGTEERSTTQIEQQAFATAFIEQQITAGAFGTTMDGYGAAMDVDGDLAVVGAPRAPNSGEKYGAAVVLEKEDGIWGASQILYPSLPQDGAEFGYAVSVSGETLAVASREKIEGTVDFYCRGAIYLFERNTHGLWQEIQRITRCNLQDGVLPGFRVSLEGDTLVSGWMRCATGDDVCYAEAVVHSRDLSQWTESQVLSPSLAAEYLQFPVHVEIDGDTIAVGLPWQIGSVWMFEKESGFWSLEQTIYPEGEQEWSGFGASMSMDDDVFLVGAPLDEECYGPDSGAAYFYERENGVWEMKQKACSSGASEHDLFGISVSLDGDLALVGSDPDGDSSEGSATIFNYIGGSWNRNLVIEATDGDWQHAFGYSLHLQGEEGFVGAPGRNHGQGAVYVYDVGCADETECPDGYCIDGICCESECGWGELYDCQGCSTMVGASGDGICEPLDGTPCIFGTDGSPGSPDGICSGGVCRPVGDDTGPPSGNDESDANDDDDDSGDSFPNCLCHTPGANRETSLLLTLCHLLPGP